MSCYRPTVHGRNGPPSWRHDFIRPDESTLLYQYVGKQPRTCSRVCGRSLEFTGLLAQWSSILLSPQLRRLCRWEGHEQSSAKPLELPKTDHLVVDPAPPQVFCCILWILLWFVSQLYYRSFKPKGCDIFGQNVFFDTAELVSARRVYGINVTVKCSLYPQNVVLTGEKQLRELEAYLELDRDHARLQDFALVAKSHKCNFAPVFA